VTQGDSGAERAPLAPPPVGQGAPWVRNAPQEALGDWVLHLLLVCVAWLIWIATLYALGLGLFLLARVFRSTGFRARDLLMLLIPFGNFYFLSRAFWRYTSTRRYWSERTDLSPQGFFGPAPVPLAR